MGSIDTMQTGRREVVWIAYSKDFPYLPVAVASNAKDLAERIGATRNTVESCWSHYKNGKSKYTSIFRIEIEEEK